MRHPYLRITSSLTRTLANPKVGGTPGTFSRHPSVPRHPGWESLG